MSAPDRDLLHQIDRFVAARFPTADVVVLGGSSTSGRATASSDIDLLLLGPGHMFGDGGSSLAAMYEHEGRLVEVFAYTPESYRDWAGRELAGYRPVIVTMLVEGMVLRGLDAGAEMRDWATRALAAGPEVDQHTLDVRRYMLSALMDDLADATDPAEIAVGLAGTYSALAEFLLLAHGRWIGSGKWSVRRLRAWDTAVAAELDDALVAGDRRRLLAVAERLLAPFGGPLQAGMVR